MSISLLTFICTSERNAPSMRYSSSMRRRMLRVCSSVHWPRSHVGLHADTLENFTSPCMPNPEDRGQRYLSTLLWRYVDAGYPWHAITPGVACAWDSSC